jgi:hypothetical protein
MRAQTFQVYTREVRVHTIYRAKAPPGGKEWFWSLNGVSKGPVQFNGFVPSLDEAKMEFVASWRDWLSDRHHSRKVDE